MQRRVAQPCVARELRLRDPARVHDVADERLKVLLTLEHAWCLLREELPQPGREQLQAFGAHLQRGRDLRNAFRGGIAQAGEPRFQCGAAKLRILGNQGAGQLTFVQDVGDSFPQFFRLSQGASLYMQTNLLTMRCNQISLHAGCDNATGHCLSTAQHCRRALSTAQTETAEQYDNRIQTRPRLAGAAP